MHEARRQGKGPRSTVREGQQQQSAIHSLAFLALGLVHLLILCQCSCYAFISPSTTLLSSWCCWWSGGGERGAREVDHLDGQQQTPSLAACPSSLLVGGVPAEPLLAWP